MEEDGITKDVISSLPASYWMEKSTRSADPVPGSDSIPFKQRIRPGMVVAWTPPAGSKGVLPPPAKNLAMIMSPVSAWAGAGSGRIRDWTGSPVVEKSSDNAKDTTTGGNGAKKYLCAIVTPGFMAGTYTVGVWQHLVVAVDQMEEEVVLEYDPATRFYYLNV